MIDNPTERGGGSGGGGIVDGGGEHRSSFGDGVEVEQKIESVGGGGVNRWSRQATEALLKIRFDMDGVFRDSSLKGPLWEEVSRKMGELGFQRSAKKCKEKFENVYKYHKRTKDGRAAKNDGKSYRFFDQLEALEVNPSPLPSLHPSRDRHQLMSTAVPPSPSIHMATVLSSSRNPLSVMPRNAVQSSLQPQIQSSRPELSSSPAASEWSSSSTSSDEDFQRRRGKKRKWKDLFGKLMAGVIRKQEELQKKFLETMEKSEIDRAAREEAWRAQEQARMKREHELLVRERSAAAEKDAAVIAFLQKVTQQNLHIPVSVPTLHAQVYPQVSQLITETPLAPPRPPLVPAQQIFPSKPLAPPPPLLTGIPVRLDAFKSENDGERDTTNNNSNATASRWPKSEVETLIQLRTNLDLKYQDNGSKGPLWEEISAAMGKLGYNRSSKRCKEKWENINKYFKKVKESSKKRPEDSKTCPYFQQLDAIYRERAKTDSPSLTPDNPIVPIMVIPEQQWPLPVQFQENESDGGSMDNEDEEDDEDEGGDYGMIGNNNPSNTVE